MASSQSTAEYLADQMALAGEITSRKMFGEYALYCDTKVVAFICDDQLFVKPTDAGRKYIGEPELAPPYPGAKDYFLIGGDRCENQDWLSDLIRVTAAELPLPKKKKAKTA
jgi:DNA transformation protein and related proteins